MYIVRHGETVWNAARRFQGALDSPLTNKGFQQANALAKRLRPISFSAIYASDLGRAFETAQIISGGNGYEVMLDKELRERNYGIFEGLNKDEVLAKYPEEFRKLKSHRPDYKIPHGESSVEFAQRVMNCVNTLVKKQLNRRFLVVTHGGFINRLLRMILEIPLTTPPRFDVENTSLNIFSYHNQEWNLETWGVTCHLR
ncbi:histidine phosphatase family protein [Candidatus Saccharibacteria bacterium]|nr:histidine phosphatase family protein [Candidatus Saccharibacteria bacterium]